MYVYKKKMNFSIDTWRVFWMKMTATAVLMSFIFVLIVLYSLLWFTTTTSADMFVMSILVRILLMYFVPKGSHLGFTWLPLAFACQVLRTRCTALIEGLLGYFLLDEDIFGIFLKMLIGGIVTFFVYVPLYEQWDRLVHLAVVHAYQVARFALAPSRQDLMYMLYLIPHTCRYVIVMLTRQDIRWSLCLAVIGDTLLFKEAFVVIKLKLDLALLVLWERRWQDFPRQTLWGGPYLLLLVLKPRIQKAVSDARLLSDKTLEFVFTVVLIGLNIVAFGPLDGTVLKYCFQLLTSWEVFGDYVAAWLYQKIKDKACEHEQVKEITEMVENAREVGSFLDGVQTFMWHFDSVYDLFEMLKTQLKDAWGALSTIHLPIDWLWQWLEPLKDMKTWSDEVPKIIDHVDKEIGHLLTKVVRARILARPLFMAALFGLKYVQMPLIVLIPRLIFCVCAFAFWSKLRTFKCMRTSLELAEIALSNLGLLWITKHAVFGLLFLITEASSWSQVVVIMGVTEASFWSHVVVIMGVFLWSAYTPHRTLVQQSLEEVRNYTSQVTLRLRRVTSMGRIIARKKGDYRQYLIAGR